MNARTTEESRPDPLVRLIDERIESMRDELVDLTQGLIRIPTVNPPGDAYTPCAEFVGRRLKARDFSVEYLRAEGSIGDSERYPRTNVVTRIEGKRPGPCVHFNSHIDVVEVGQGWTKDPFGGLVENDRVYGRGAADMKGGLAASIIAVEAILDSGIEFNGALEISGTVDEESGGYGGVAWLAERGYFSRPRVDHVIIPEPVNPDRVMIGHRGAFWSEVETIGRIAHGSMPFLGVSAIRHMGLFLEQLEKKLYPELNKRFTAMPVAPEGARAATLNINSIHGGQMDLTPGGGMPSPNVADRCRCVLDRRWLIEENLQSVRGEILEILENLKDTVPDFDFTMRDLWSIDPSMTSPDAEVVRALSAEIKRIMGKDPVYIASPGSYDQKHVNRIGKLFECVAYGPGYLDICHQPDEWVGINEMIASAKVMARAALTLTKSV